MIVHIIRSKEMTRHVGSVMSARLYCEMAWNELKQPSGDINDAIDYLTHLNSILAKLETELTSHIRHRETGAEVADVERGLEADGGRSEGVEL